MTKKTYVGKEVVRVDAIDKVTGKTRYAGDIKLPNMCYGKILFSAYPRARVCQIKTRYAESLPGVRKIITAKDIPGHNLYGYDIHHRPVLVPEGEETRFIGDAITLVVAETQETAWKALNNIQVDYDVLTPITSPRQAMEEPAYQLHPGPDGNVCCRQELIHGDMTAGFTTSEVVVEQTYFTSRQEQAFLETESGVAYMDDSDILHIFSSLQDPYTVIEDVSYALGIPKSRIHVKGTPVGGGFGGKLETTMQVHLAAMAYLARVPVMIVFEREESFIFHPKRHPTEIKVKIGATREGKIQALEAEVLTDAGPYSGRSPEVLGFIVSSLSGPYSIPNVHISGLAIYTNNLNSGAMRGFGAPQAALAREGILDKLAKALGMEPLTLRQKNFLKAGERPINPMLGDSPVSLELLKDRLIQKIGPLPRSSRNPSKRVGRGFCFDLPMFDVSAIPVLGKSGVGIAVELFSDASACVYAGGTELGQGISTVLTQIVCDELGLEANRIFVEMSDTWTCPRAGRTSGSRLTYVLGNALLLATDKIRYTLLEQAEKMLKISKDYLFIREGMIHVRGLPTKSVSLQEVASACSNEGIKLREEAWFKHPENRYMFGHTFMGSGAEVEVDLATGEIKVLKLVNVHDTGKVINPILAKGQLYGGAIQALGYCLMEEMVLKDGYLETPSFTEYHIPTALDLPEEFFIESVEIPYPTGPYGAKGIAEHALNSTTPAILNAISNATGVEFTTIPVYPEHILRALKAR